MLKTRRLKTSLVLLLTAVCGSVIVVSSEWLANARYLEIAESSYAILGIDMNSFEPRTLSLFYVSYDIYVYSENGAPFRGVIFQQNPYNTLPFGSKQDDIFLSDDLFIPRQMMDPPHRESRDLSKGQPPLEWRLEQDYWLDLSGLKIAGPWESTVSVQMNLAIMTLFWTSLVTISTNSIAYEFLANLLKYIWSALSKAGGV